MFDVSGARTKIVPATTFDSIAMLCFSIDSVNFVAECCQGFLFLAFVEFADPASIIPGDLRFLR